MELLKIIPTREPGFTDEFTFEGVQYGFIPSWKNMSFGEFPDLDTLMTKKPEEFLNYLHIITAILYRPITKRKGKHKFEIEEYNVHTMEERAELFRDKLNVEYALGSQFFFIHFKDLFSKYPNIFEDVDENQLDGDKVRMEMEKENMDKSMEEKFGWYLVLNRIANDDITRHDSITKKGIIEALNMLSYLIEKDKEEIKRMKKANNII